MDFCLLLDGTGLLALPLFPVLIEGDSWSCLRVDLSERSSDLWECLGEWWLLYELAAETLGEFLTGLADLLLTDSLCDLFKSGCARSLSPFFGVERFVGFPRGLER